MWIRKFRKRAFEKIEKLLGRRFIKSDTAKYLWFYTPASGCYDNGMFKEKANIPRSKIAIISSFSPITTFGFFI